MLIYRVQRRVTPVVGQLSTRQPLLTPAENTLESARTLAAEHEGAEVIVFEADGPSGLVNGRPV
jgi:hypothetical protein